MLIHAGVSVAGREQAVILLLGENVIDRFIDILAVRSLARHMPA